MIELIFYFGTEIIMIKVDGKNITFSNSSYGALQSTIDGLRLSKVGVIKEFPDLKDREDWHKEAIKRFKEKMDTLQTEEAIVEYLKYDLQKFGYIPKYKQKKGFRREKL